MAALGEVGGAVVVAGVLMAAYGLILLTVDLLRGVVP